jgi:hypothetical protein
MPFTASEFSRDVVLGDAHQPRWQSVSVGDGIITRLNDIPIGQTTRCDCCDGVPMLEVELKHIVDFPFLVFGIAFLAQWFSAWLADWSRVWIRPLREREREDLGVVLSAALTLLGLLIAFSFSMATSRDDQRKNFEEAEANAIGTAYVRAGLLPAPDAAKVRELLRTYLNQRELFYTTRDERQLRQIAAHTTALQSELWSSMHAVATAQPTPLVALAVSSMNDVLNSQGYTQAAWWNRIPVAAWGLMMAIAICCNLLLGYRARGSLLLLVMPFIVSISFFLIADIDSPRGGVIRVLPQNLVALSQSLNRRAP